MLLVEPGTDPVEEPALPTDGFAPAPLAPLIEPLPVVAPPVVPLLPMVPPLPADVPPAVAPSVVLPRPVVLPALAPPVVPMPLPLPSALVFGREPLPGAVLPVEPALGGPAVMQSSRSDVPPLVVPLASAPDWEPLDRFSAAPPPVGRLELSPGPADWVQAPTIVTDRVIAETSIGMSLNLRMVCLLLP